VQTLQDPSIKQMAEQIASDPSFKAVTESLQQQFGAMFAGQQGEGAAARDPAAAAAAAAGPGGFDPSKYMQAMTGMFQNKDFMEMAEKLGRSIIEVALSTSACTQFLCLQPEAVRTSTAKQPDEGCGQQGWCHAIFACTLRRTPTWER
jgi:hypothetical protein